MTSEAYDAFCDTGVLKKRLWRHDHNFRCNSFQNLDLKGFSRILDATWLCKRRCPLCECFLKEPGVKANKFWVCCTGSAGCQSPYDGLLPVYIHPDGGRAKVGYVYTAVYIVFLFPQRKVIGGNQRKSSVGINESHRWESTNKTSR